MKDLPSNIVRLIGRKITEIVSHNAPPGAPIKLHVGSHLDRVPIAWF
jgi:hypothetical protein